MSTSPWHFHCFFHYSFIFSNIVTFLEVFSKTIFIFFDVTCFVGTSTDGLITSLSPEKILIEMFFKVAVAFLSQPLYISLLQFLLLFASCFLGHSEFWIIESSACAAILFLMPCCGNIWPDKYHPSKFWPVIVQLAVPTNTLGIFIWFVPVLLILAAKGWIQLAVWVLVGSVISFVSLFGFPLCHLVSLILGAGGHSFEPIYGHLLEDLLSLSLTFTWTLVTCNSSSSLKHLQREVFHD